MPNDSSQKMPPGSSKTRTQKRPAFFRKKLHNQQRRKRANNDDITKRLPIPAVLITNKINVKHGKNDIKENIPPKTVIFRHKENDADESHRQQNRRSRAQKRQFFPTQSFSPSRKSVNRIQPNQSLNFRRKNIHQQQKKQTNTAENRHHLRTNGRSQIRPEPFKHKNQGNKYPQLHPAQPMSSAEFKYPFKNNP